MKKLLLVLCCLLPLHAQTYVGDKACKSCHQAQHKEWTGSHHDLAMQEANEETVLGDFSGVNFEYNDITSRFYKKDKKFMVRTDGEDGKLHDYEVSYTFGVYPLQQYMVKFPKGKVQVLDIAWDSRSQKEGGQKWFHIHAHEDIKAGDVLHWTGPNFNWNFMCADCHSTNLKKNYNPKTKTYHTKYDQINVSCESCHGPASEHLKWAKKPKSYKGTLKEGLSIDLSSYTKNRWTMDAKTHKPKLLGKIDRTEVELCAKCHSRRAQLDDDFTPGDSFTDHYLPAELTQALYFPDGKIKDEVYMYNSFKQSAMYEAGVTCSDCHNPHTLERKAVGDNVCNQCHNRADYENQSHSFHKKGEASCIDCHMPSRIYMGVDERNDHSFRVPRPDLSVGTDIPNACNNCHTDKDALWATENMKKWYGKVPVGKQNFAHQISALQRNSEDAQQFMYDLLMSNAPDIAKQTAIASLGNYPSKQTYTTTLQMTSSQNPLKRLNALKSLEVFQPRMRIRKTFQMLGDSDKIVRTEAARQLSTLEVSELDAATKADLKKAMDEYEQTLLFNADRAESQTALAEFYSNQHRLKEAEKAYKEALRIQSKFIPAYANYAYFKRSQGKEKEALSILNQGLKEVPESVALSKAIGLWYIRNNEEDKALPFLKKASNLDLDDAHAQYTYAIALSETDIPSAIKVLDASYQRHTGDLQVLYALVFYTQKIGDEDKLKFYHKQTKALENFRVKAQSEK